MQDRIQYEKAVACVVRWSNEGPDLLVFKHPAGEVQIPKGTLEPDEVPERAVLREFQEESGVSAVCIRSKIGAFLVPIGQEPETSISSFHRWHVFWLEPTEALPESWQHVAVGSQEEEGLVFSYSWIPLAVATRIVHPRFRQTCLHLLAKVEARAGPILDS